LINLKELTLIYYVVMYLINITIIDEQNYYNNMICIKIVTFKIQIFFTNFNKHINWV